jgi:hypothetical protein
MRDSITLKASAHKNPSTTNPCTIMLVKRMSKAFIIKVKNPIVRIVIGRVNKTSNGFTTAFKIPKTSETITAVRKLATCIPGRRYAAATTDNDDNNHRISISIGLLW